MNINSIKDNLIKALQYWGELYPNAPVRFTDEGPPGNRQPPGSKLLLNAEQQRWVQYGNYWHELSKQIPRYERETCEQVHKFRCNEDVYARVSEVAQKRGISTNTVFEYANHALYTVARKVLILRKKGD